MPGKRRETMEIREMLRRFQQGQSNRSIANDLGLHRLTHQARMVVITGTSFRAHRPKKEVAFVATP